MFQVQARAVTDIGNERLNNEDCYLIEPTLKLYAVCDGMGGHAAGEVASEKALEFAADHIRQHKSLLDAAVNSSNDYTRVVAVAREALCVASEQLHRLSLSESRFSGMGTTMTMLLVVGSKGIMAHVGDSRLYLLRGGGVHLLSTDHTLANELLHCGAIGEDDVEGGGYDHILTRSVGQGASLDVESVVFDLLPDDMCLICSDGLSRYFVDAEHIKKLIDGTDFDTVPHQLVQMAKSRGGCDNITAIVLRVLRP
jgi:serine/threonine protein phosphatase PrpC